MCKINYYIPDWNWVLHQCHVYVAADTEGQIQTERQADREILSVSRYRPETIYHSMSRPACAQVSVELLGQRLGFAGLHQGGDIPNPAIFVMEVRV